MSSAPGVSLAHVRVHDAIHAGILTCEPGTPLRAVARLMAEHRVHAVAVAEVGPGRRAWGIVSARHVVAAAAAGTEGTAGEAAVTEVLKVSSDDRLDHAAQLMAKHELTHLVVDSASGHPTGVFSALDLAAVDGGQAAD